ncbi:MAG: hypothetical protein ACJAWV_004183 [Flammeovirgaceae bacterium]
MNLQFSELANFEKGGKNKEKGECLNNRKPNGTYHDF